MGYATSSSSAPAPPDTPPRSTPPEPSGGPLLSVSGIVIGAPSRPPPRSRTSPVSPRGLRDGYAEPGRGLATLEAAPWRATGETGHGPLVPCCGWANAKGDPDRPRRTADALSGPRFPSLGARFPSPPRAGLSWRRQPAGIDRLRAAATLRLLAGASRLEEAATRMRGGMADLADEVWLPDRAAVAEGNRASAPRVTGPRSAGQRPSVPPDSEEGTLRRSVGMGDTGRA